MKGEELASTVGLHMHKRVCSVGFVLWLSSCEVGGLGKLAGEYIVRVHEVGIPRRVGCVDQVDCLR